MIRLDKFLSDAGLGTRKHVKKAIRSGKALVNGVIQDDGAHLIDPSKDIVIVDNHLIEFNDEIFLLMNKPEGYMCSTIDERYPSVLNLIDPSYRKRTRIVGRLDADTTGVLLLTSNGKLNNRLIHPNTKIEKEYEASLDHGLTEEDYKKLTSGPIELDKDTSVTPKKIEIIQPYIIKIVVTEGKYHEIKRIFKKYGYTVIKLKRIRLGFLTADGVKEGEYRKLTKEEILKIKEITKMEDK